MTTDSTPTVVPPPMPVMAPMTVSHGEKLKKFNGTKFKRSQQKMLFYLTTLNLARFLQEDAPALKENETDRQVVSSFVEGGGPSSCLVHHTREHAVALPRAQP